jgi:hypothetical protein
VTKQYIKVYIDIHCKRKSKPRRGPVPVPVYRVYVNDELFAERTWIWQDSYLIEMLQIEAEPGQYVVRLESVRPKGGKFKTRNHRVDYGPAQWINGHILEIYDES